MPTIRLFNTGYWSIKRVGLCFSSWLLGRRSGLISSPQEKKSLFTPPLNSKPVQNPNPHRKRPPSVDTREHRASSKTKALANVAGDPRRPAPPQRRRLLLTAARDHPPRPPLLRAHPPHAPSPSRRRRVRVALDCRTPLLGVPVAGLLLQGFR
jgi:hypothetical protein